MEDTWKIDYERGWLEKYQIGQRIVEQLFAMPLVTLRTTLRELTSDYNFRGEDVFDVKCIKTFEEDIPDSIEFNSYTRVKIDWSGITVIPEHRGGQCIVKFNKNFKL